MSAPQASYAELDLVTNFSFLEGGSHPRELVEQAKALGLSAIGIADRNTLAGVVRAHSAARDEGFRILIGCRLVFRDQTELIVYPRDRAAYGRLCRLLSLGKSRVVDDPDFVGEQRPVQDNTESDPLPPWERVATQSPGEGPSRPDGVGGPALAHLELVQASASPIADAASHPVAAQPPSPTRGEGSEERIPKGETWLDFEDAVAFGQGLVAIATAPADLTPAFETRLTRWRQAWPDKLYLGANLMHRGDDRTRLAVLSGISARAGTPMLAVNSVLYHHFERRPLQDVLTCIREKTTIDEAGARLQANAERYLKPPAEMLRLLRGYEDAIARGQEILEACPFSLDELKYQYPDEPVPPGKTADQHLRSLSIAGARKHFPEGVPASVTQTLLKELRLIRKLKYPHYFLTVHDIVQWARRENILCQGRGSAANSVVCFCLEVTGVNPIEQDLLIERFISEERSEPPDIDVDFEHERREEVMQYVYRRYGRHRAAICATVIHYRPRSTIRDVGKALGLTEDVTAALANTVWGSYGPKIEDQHVDRTGLAREDPRLALALSLTEQLVNFPRHLSQHVGGYVLTQGPLVETVPIGNGAMKDRTFIEWDKDDIDELKIMKVDILALGMLTAIRKAFDMIEQHYGPHHGLLDLPREDADVYEMLCKADSLGVFQVESRAQMSMLPRLQPRKFYDLVVEVAIVRPGPIQGKMVHPYLTKRGEMREAERRGLPFDLDFPAPSPDHGHPNELKDVLRKTMGVPLFQEQAMKIAMVAAKFSGGEANGLRRAMATFRHMGTIQNYESMMVGRMIDRGYDVEFANNCFNQIKGFGEYGFPESHAAAFAHLVYVSAWIKWRHPEVFAAALMNSQPMGFYAPAQIVRDARDHGVEVFHPDVNISEWDLTLEAPSTAHLLDKRPPRMQARPDPNRMALRLGLRQIDGFKQTWAVEIAKHRPYASLDDLRHRASLPAHALDALAAADALSSLELGRRTGLWAAKGLPRAKPAPLFAAFGLDEADGAPPASLPAMPASEEVVRDYETIRLSLKAHPISFLRDRFERQGMRPCGDVETIRNGARASLAGVVLVRQRPGTAKGVCFITLEDESGIANVVVWPAIFDKYRPVIMGARMLCIHGRIQRAEGVTHLVAERLEDRTGDLSLLSGEGLRTSPSPGDGARTAAPDRGERPQHRHPRDVRVLPPSRDFH